MVGGPETGLDVYLWIFAFAIRFYCDFSGYSDMARGLALLMGIHLSVNFHLPYLASNPGQLWSRWHMTLTRWFRDNVYGPLRGLPRFLAVVLTMSLVGLWHGASWNFVAWGLAWGGVLIAYQLVQPVIRGLASRYPAGASPVLQIGGVLLTFHVWLMLGHFFTLSSLPHAFHTQWLMTTDLFNPSKLSFRDALTVLYYSWPLIVMQTAQAWSKDMQIVFRAPYAVRYLIYLLMFLLLLGNGAETDRDFIYFQF